MGQVQLRGCCVRDVESDESYAILELLQCTLVYESLVKAEEEKGNSKKKTKTERKRGMDPLG